MKAAPETAPSFADALAPHYRDALRYCRPLCADGVGEEADDLFQQSLLQALAGYQRLRDPNAFRSWLFRIITRCHRQSRRWLRAKRFVSLEHVTDAPDMPSVFAHAPPDASGIELLAALAKLSHRASARRCSCSHRNIRMRAALPSSNRLRCHSVSDRYE